MRNHMAMEKHMMIFFTGQLEELLTGYGELFTVWFDGACGEGENGALQIYDWDRYYGLIRKYQPNACISVCGPDVRWCGNEAGVCRESEWSVVPSSLKDNEKIAEKSQQEDGSEFINTYSSQDMDLGSIGKVINETNLSWYPAEVDTSIRPGWYYHKEHDDKVRSIKELRDIYISSVGGNATLLLNIPPNKDGLLHENDVKALSGLGDELEKMFSENILSEDNVISQNDSNLTNILDCKDDTYWTSKEYKPEYCLLFEFNEPKNISIVEMCENIKTDKG